MSSMAVVEDWARELRNSFYDSPPFLPNNVYNVEEDDEISDVDDDELDNTCMLLIRYLDGFFPIPFTKWKKQKRALQKKHKKRNKQNKYSKTTYQRKNQDAKYQQHMNQ